MRSLWVVVLAVGPQVAWAQLDDEAPRREGTQKVAPEPPLQRPAMPAEDDEGAPRSPASAHTVTEGDTLWDLSRKYLGSPWYWPKVWSYNPEIGNPHWIYPGNVVRFSQSGEEVPSPVTVGTGGGGATELGSGPEVEEGSLLDEGDDRGILIGGRIGYAPRQTVALPLAGFLTPREIEESGHITGSFAENHSLGPGDEVYVEFRNRRLAKLGERFVLFRPGKLVDRPGTGEPVGYITQVVGLGEVRRLDAVSGRAVLGIVKQFDEVLRSDLVGPSGEDIVRRVQSRRNERDVKGGVVLGATTPHYLSLGEGETIIVDRGADHGVKVGNVFVIFRRQDAYDVYVGINPAAVYDESQPEEVIAACMAFEVKSNSTTCLLTKTVREVLRGDRVELRASK